MKTGWILVFCVSFAGALWADTITHGSTSIDMGFQTIGQAGNTDDTTGYGAVDYTYRIATYEVTVDQWNAAVAADAGITNNTIWPPYETGSKPADRVSWIEAARFCNWLTSGNALQGAYLFSDVDTLTGIDRSAAVSLYGTVYVLPTEDEWYKAAYFTGSGYSLYADGTDSAPSFNGWNYDYWGEFWNVGSGYAEQNGTYDMMGNAYELTESVYDGVIGNIMSEDWAVRGGGEDSGFSEGIASSYRTSGRTDGEEGGFGFRVVAIPEPATAIFFGLGGLGAWLLRRNRLRKDSDE